MEATDELDLSFDMSYFLGDEAASPETFCCENDGDKKFPDIVNDVNLLDTTWLNRPSIGELGGFGVNRSEEPTEPLSDTESVASECNSTMSSIAPSPALSENGVEQFGFRSTIEDKELVGLSVKDLNCKLKGFPKDSVKKYKRRRRTLKNRGYAHSCRQKRLSEKSCLQVSNQDLEQRYVNLQCQMQVMTGENGRMKSRLAQHEHLLRRIAEQFDFRKILRKGI